MNKHDAFEKYFEWLCRKVGVNRPEGSYYTLFRHLHSTEFRYFVVHDDSRAMDGIALRERFISETPLYGMPDSDDTLFPEECTVLEMLIALSERMEFEAFCGYRDESRWFWAMLSNLGLTAYTDDSWTQLDGSLSVQCILDTMMDRDYAPDGDGGLFPLINPSCDQRDVEIWYQMQAFMQEGHR